MKPMRHISFCILSTFLSIVLGGSVLAVDNEEQLEGCRDDTRVYGLCLGYEDLSMEGGGETLLPYSLLDPNPMAKGRYHQPVGKKILNLTFSWEGEDYYHLDSEYYGVTGILTARSQKFTRNLEHLNLPGPADSPSSAYWSQDLDPGDEYGTDQQEHFASYRYRWTKYPANVSVAFRQYRTEGRKQQLFLNENCTTNCHAVSRTRDVNTSTDQFFLSGSAHVGILDAAYRYKNTAFKDGEDDPVYAFGTIPGFSGTRDVHNTYPDLDSSEHLITLSTNHTGRYSGLLSFGSGSRENKDSGVSEDYRLLLGRFLWRPSVKTSVFLDSKQFYKQDDSPPSDLQMSRLADGAPLRYGTLVNRHKFTLNYYPLDILDLKGELLLTDMEREDSEYWGIPGNTSSTEWRLTARMEPAPEVKLKAAFTDKATDDPAYRATPTDSRKMTLAGRWTPASGVCLEADLRDFDDRNTQSGQANDRRILGAAVSYTPPRPYTLAFRVYRFTNDISADVTFADITPVPVIDENVPYSAEGTQYVMQAVWSAGKKLQFTGQYSYLRAEGSYDADPTGFPAFGDVEEFSGLDAVQKESSLDMKYTMDGGWGLTARLARLSYADRESSLEDEEVSQISASVSRRW